ncbi:hypothetical protein DJ84_23265, partial [Halorubrum ezzemoulense]
MSWGVNWKASVGLLGVGIKYLAVTMLVPLVVALAYGEDIWVFLVSMALVAALGFAIERVDPDPDLGPREALLFVSLAWL